VIARIRVRWINRIGERERGGLLMMVMVMGMMMEGGRKGGILTIQQRMSGDASMPMMGT